MTFDGLIIFTSFSVFIIFFIVFSFATFKFPLYPIHNIFFSFCISFLISIIISWIYIPALFIRIFSIILSGLLAITYVFGVYLNLDSSLHVRILREIANAGLEGITYNGLLQKYNKKIILEKRLLRLVNSGEITRIGNTFQLQRSFSTLLLREKIIVFLTKLYGK